MEQQSMKDRLLLTWDITRIILLSILILPIIILFVIFLIVVAMVDTYLISIVYFIIWIINGSKNYWYVTKKISNLFMYIVNKIK